jgi:dTDP-4-dehydrorhamnose reductase
MVSFSPTKVQTEEVITTSQQEKNSGETKITSLYGLDVDLLRILNMGDLVEEKTKALATPKEASEFSNLNMDQMRETFGTMPE